MSTSTTQEALQPLDGCRILVTGASGFIGSRLALRLAQAGAHVVGVCRNLNQVEPFPQPSIELVQGDITDAARLDFILSKQFDLVMHLAAWMRGSSLSEADRVNCDATQCLAELSAKYNVHRFIYVSSIAVYGLHGDTDVDEAIPVHPYNDPYGDSKIHGEAALQRVSGLTGLPIVIVRPGMVYGPGSMGWTTRMAIWARSGRMLLVNGGHAAAYPIYVDNLIDLLLLCATHPRAEGHIFNAVDDGLVTVGEFCGAYMRMVPTQRAIRLPGCLFKGMATMVNPFFSGMNLLYLASQLTGRGQVLNQKAKAILGWKQQITLDEGLRRSEAWLRQEGIL